jgi:hypothetical protein
MDRSEARKYVGYCVDDALSPHPISEIPEPDTLVRYVGWQCGFEPMFVAVWSYLSVHLFEGEAEEIAQDYLKEIGWLQPDQDGEYRDADYVF